jgi:hypothetical protein
VNTTLIGRILNNIDDSYRKQRKLERAILHQMRRQARLKKLLAREQTVPLFAEEVAS